MSAQPPVPEDLYYRLVLWNIGLTLLDAARVNRAAYAEAFRAVTGRPLVQVPQMAGRTDSETFFEALAVNAAGPQPGDPAGEELLGRFATQLAAAFRARRDLLSTQGRLMPGARDAVAAVWRLPGLVQTVLTGSIRPNAIEVLRAFGLDRYLATEIGAFGSEVYPKGAMVLRARGRSSAGELRDAGADVVLDGLADTAAVVAAVDQLTVPIRS